MEINNIDQIEAESIGVLHPTLKGCICIAQADQAIFVEPQSIPALIEALKKYVE